MKPACLFACLFCASAFAAEPNGAEIEIPLDRVWAYDMPGTRDINELMQKPPGGVRRLTSFDRIRRQLASEPADYETFTGFAVAGPPRGALSFAEQGITAREVPMKNWIVTTEETYAAFFSKACAYRIEIERVTRRGNTIDIRYRFVPRYSPKSTIGLALIPLGKLPVGEYRVEINQAPMAQQYLDSGFEPVSAEAARNIVCQPFSFSVNEAEVQIDDEPREGEGGVVIPLDEIWAWGMPGTRDVQELPAARKDDNLVRSIRRALKPVLNRKQARPGFVVSGIGDEALRRAHDIIVGKEDVKDEFARGTDLSAVFFAYQSPFFVELEKVERNEREISIDYRFVPHESGVTTEHFALIPFGKLPSGKYVVRVEQGPMKTKYIDMGFPQLPRSAGQQLVSQTFHFIVAD